MARTVNHKELAAKRRLIMEAAVQLITDKGYESFSINQVVQTLGISKSSFFHHFKSKEALVDEIVAFVTEPVKESYNLAVADTGRTGKETMAELFSVSGAIKAGRKNSIRSLMQLFYKKENSGLLYQIVENSYALCVPYFEDIILRGCATGEFRLPYPQGTARHFLRLVMDMNEQIGRHLYTEGKGLDEWLILQNELLAFEHIASMLFGTTENEPLYGKDLQNRIAGKIQQLQNENKES